MPAFRSRLFDRLNSRLPHGLGDRGALTPDNLLEVEAFFLMAENELRGLTHLNGRPVILGQQQTFIVGYIGNMKASIALAKEIFSKAGTSTPRFLQLYRLSQDPLEHFFGDLRSRGHWCLNPTALYFMHSYRALVSNRLQLYGLSQGRNCTELQDVDRDDMLSSVDDGVDLDMEQQHWESILCKLQSSSSGNLQQNVLFYMSGWAVRQVLKVLKCDECKAVLVSAEPHQPSLSRLTLMKQKGGLIYASRSAYRVILLADMTLEHELLMRNVLLGDKRLLMRLLHATFKVVSADRLTFRALADHDGTSLMEQHGPRLIRLLATKYFNARLGHLGNLRTSSAVGAASSRRNQQTRALIFRSL